MAYTNINIIKHVKFDALYNEINKRSLEFNIYQIKLNQIIFINMIIIYKFEDTNLNSVQQIIH